MEHTVVTPGTRVTDPQEHSPVQAVLISLRANLQHTAVVARAVLPRGKRGSASVAALKHRPVSGVVVGWKQEQRRIQIAGNVQIACHRVPGFLHTAQVGYGARRRCGSRAAVGNRQCGAQLQRPATVDIPGSFSHLPNADPGAVRHEVQDNALGADADGLLHVIEIVGQSYLQVIAVQSVKGLRQELVGCT